MRKSSLSRLQWLGLQKMQTAPIVTGYEGDKALDSLVPQYATKMVDPDDTRESRRYRARVYTTTLQGTIEVEATECPPLKLTDAGSHWFWYLMTHEGSVSSEYHDSNAPANKAAVMKIAAEGGIMAITREEGEPGTRRYWAPTQAGKDAFFETEWGRRYLSDARYEDSVADIDTYFKSVQGNSAGTSAYLREKAEYAAQVRNPAYAEVLKAQANRMDGAQAVWNLMSKDVRQVAEKVDCAADGSVVHVNFLYNVKVRKGYHTGEGWMVDFSGIKVDRYQAAPFANMDAEQLGRTLLGAHMMVRILNGRDEAAKNQ